MQIIHHSSFDRIITWGIYLDRPVCLGGARFWDRSDTSGPAGPVQPTSSPTQSVYQPQVSGHHPPSYTQYTLPELAANLQGVAHISRACSSVARVATTSPFLRFLIVYSGSSPSASTQSVRMPFQPSSSVALAVQQLQPCACGPPLFLPSGVPSFAPTLGPFNLRQLEAQSYSGQQQRLCIK